MSLITVNNIIVVSKCHRLLLSLIAVNRITLIPEPYREERKRQGHGERERLDTDTRIFRTHTLILHYQSLSHTSQTHKENGMYVSVSSIELGCSILAVT